MKTRNKALVLTLCAVLLVVATVMGTLAYLTAQSQTITNTFTVGNITVELAETTGNTYKMVPGYTITKDPKAKVVAGSEECFLFVKLEKSANFDEYLTYEMAGDWTALTGVDGVYYREVLTDDIGTEYSVLKDNKVSVKGDVTKTMMENLTEETQPTLKVTAYASQLYKNATEKFTAAEAWVNIGA